MARGLSALGVTLLLCLCQVLTMLGAASFPALIPEFVSAWDLSNTEAGWIAGIYNFGYVAAVPLLVTLTDRRDAKAIYILSALLAGFSHLAFAWLAEGFWSALILRALAGAGLAGNYMVGLRLLSDRVTGPRSSRALSYYTSCFSIGTALSVLMAGESFALFGWQAAFLLAGAGALLAALLLIPFRSASRPEGKPPSLARLLDPRPVFANKRAMAYVLGYAGHVWELFGLRAWVVAFLVFAALEAGREESFLAPTRVVFLMLLVALPASVFGNEMALKLGRRRWTGGALAASGLLSCLVGFAAGLPLPALVTLLLLYSFAVNADSSALTTGVVEAADPQRKGATMALHSLMGFGAGSLSPLVFGLLLDGFGAGSALAWGPGFASLALGPLLGVWALARLGRRA
jgi:MFS family permease